MNLKKSRKFKKSIYKKLDRAVFNRYWMPVWNQLSSEIRNEIVLLDHDLHDFIYIRIHNRLQNELKKSN